MKTYRNTQHGGSHVVLLIVVVLVAVVGFAAYRVMGAQKKTTVSNATTSGQSTVATPAKIQSKADVTQASKSLDSVQIDSGLDSSALDADLNSLF